MVAQARDRAPSACCLGGKIELKQPRDATKDKRIEVRFGAEQDMILLVPLEVSPTNLVGENYVCAPVE